MLAQLVTSDFQLRRLARAGLGCAILVTGCVLIAVTALTTALRIAGDAGDPLKARDGMEPGGQHGEAAS